jgi:hypothetical protein
MDASYGTNSALRAGIGALALTPSCRPSKYVPWPIRMSA